MPLIQNAKEFHSISKMVIACNYRKMYNVFSLTSVFTYGVTTIRKTMAEIEAEGDLRPDGTLVMYGSSLQECYLRCRHA